MRPVRDRLEFMLTDDRGWGYRMDHNVEDIRKVWQLSGYVPSSIPGTELDRTLNGEIRAVGCGMKLS